MGRVLPEELIFESRVTAYMETFFKKMGARTERTNIQPGRDNLVAFMDPPGNPSQTILFEAHQDTVPIDGMTIDPFGAKIEAGKLYGRGACDVKGGMASMATAFARLFKQKKAGMQPKESPLLRISHQNCCLCYIVHRQKTGGFVGTGILFSLGICAANTTIKGGA